MVGLEGKDKEVLSGLKTENRNSRTLDLDLTSVRELLTMTNEKDKDVIKAVEQALPQIQETMEAVICVLGKGGRLIYAGAGASGRLGILDAVEYLPIFSTTDEVVGITAGGEEVFVHARGGMEDSKEEGRKDLKHLKVDEWDVAVVLSASGRTPYCIGALECAGETGTCCMGLSCNRPAELTDYSDIVIEMDTDPEILTGSTRLKAGTAEKMILNMIFTAAMAGVGKVHGNLMVDMRATNLKPVEQAKRIVPMVCDYTGEIAQATLELADGGVKAAIVMIPAGITTKEAKGRLEIHKGFVRKCSDDTHGRD